MKQGVPMWTPDTPRIGSARLALSSDLTNAEWAGEPMIHRPSAAGGREVMSARVLNHLLRL